VRSRPADESGGARQADGGGPRAARRPRRGRVHPGPAGLGAGAASGPPPPRAGAVMLLDSNVIIYSAHPDHSDLRRLIAERVPAVSAVSIVEVIGYHRLA